MELDEVSLRNTAEGATFLGTGGGGDPYTGRLVAQRVIERYGPPRIIGLDELDDEANVYVAAMMGTPAVMVEKIIGAAEMDLSVSALEKYTGRPADAIIAAEMGGCNSMVPLAVTFNVHGVNASPMSMANEHGESIIINARNSHETELKARSLIIEMGGTAAISAYPMDGRTAKKVAIPGTLTLALQIGNALEEGRRQGRAVAALIEFLRSTEYYGHARQLFEGKVTNLDRRIVGGFTRGACHIRGHGDAAPTMVLEYQNEHLVAWIGDEVQAMVPDLVCVLDSDTGTPVTTEGLKYGQRVSVVAASVPPIMRSDAALATFGPRAFGYDFDFVPVEALAGDR